MTDPTIPDAATVDKILDGLENFADPPTEVARKARRLRAYIASLQPMESALKDARPWLIAMTKQGEDRYWRPAKRHLAAFDKLIAKIDPDYFRGGEPNGL